LAKPQGMVVRKLIYLALFGLSRSAASLLPLYV
jgi:hypothetical protein